MEIPSRPIFDEEFKNGISLFIGKFKKFMKNLDFWPQNLWWPFLDHILIRQGRQRRTQTLNRCDWGGLLACLKNESGVLIQDSKLFIMPKQDILLKQYTTLKIRDEKFFSEFFDFLKILKNTVLGSKNEIFYDFFWTF